jgi:hypothetical protein
LISAPTGLQLTTAVNPFTDSELTWSIQDTNNGPTVRYDYILPCGLLFSNITSSQVFRTDLLTNPPPPLKTNDNTTASDHLPVIMFFGNPYARLFHLISIARSNETVALTWEAVPGQPYRVDMSSNLSSWSVLASNLLATNLSFTLNTNATGDPQFFRVYRVP